MIHTWLVFPHHINKDFSRYKWRSVPDFLFFLSFCPFFSFSFFLTKFFNRGLWSEHTLGGTSRILFCNGRTRQPKQELNFGSKQPRTDLIFADRKQGDNQMQRGWRDGARRDLSKKHKNTKNGLRIWKINTISWRIQIWNFWTKMNTKEQNGWENTQQLKQKI